MACRMRVRVRVRVYAWLWMAALGFPASTVEAGWRSEMFPEDWVPLDERVVEGVNRFLDERGTFDLYGRSVFEGHPDYHPYRFLHDFSYAGYRRGEAPIPPEDPCWQPPPVYDVTKPPYGCIPDGSKTHNCTPGIQKAIDDAGASGGGIVYLPAGEYRLISSSVSHFLRIARSGVVLRGDGPDRTRLLVDPYQATSVSMYLKPVLRVQGVGTWRDDASTSTVRTGIVQDVLLPTRVIPVADATTFAVGDPVVILGRRTDAFLAEHDMAGTWVTHRPAYLFRRTVVAVDPGGGTIAIDIPTRYRIRRTDQPEVVLVRPGISEVGVERLAVGMIRHPDVWYYTGDITVARDTHDPPIIHDLWQTRAFLFQNVRDSWIWDVESYRPDQNAGLFAENRLTGKRYGDYEVEVLNEVLLIEQGNNITVKNLRFKNAQVDAGNSNGYAIRVSGSENLLENVVIEKMKKGFALMNSWASGNVIKDCATIDPLGACDLLHWELSMSNLIDNHTLAGGYWTAVIQGVDSVGQGHSTSETVFWNIRGLRAPDTAISTTLDRDNDDDGIPDPYEAHGDLPDVALVISNQYGWGYVVGTHGPFSDARAASMQRRVGSDWSTPHMFPRDYTEGIGYDEQGIGELEPRSLYEAQLALRLGTPPPPQNIRPTAMILDIRPSPAGVGELMTFEGAGTDADGAVVAWRWRSDLDGLLSLEASFSTAALSAGVHQISFDVQDDLGLWSEPATAILEVRSTTREWILDDGDPGTTAAGYWPASGGTDAYGGGSVYSKQNGATYRYDFSGLPTGSANVYLWWSTWPSRPTSVPVDVVHAAGTSRVLVDQLAGGGRWVKIGTWSFSGNARVTITSLGLGSTCADAVKIETVGENANARPLAEMILMEPCPATEGEAVSFEGAGTDPDGAVVAWRWSSDLDGVLSLEASFSTAALSVGVHQISFDVQDDLGLWSEPAAAVLEVHSANARPTAEIVAIEPSPATEGEAVSFQGAGTDADGAVVAWRWSSDLDGVLSLEASFSTAALSAGIHGISFEVQDDLGLWSEPATAVLEVRSANARPTAEIVAIEPCPATEGETVSFQGAGTDADGTVVAWRWSSDLDGVLSLDASFSTAALSVGIHGISFEVQDDLGLWSLPATAPLEVRPANPRPLAEIILMEPCPATEGEAVSFEGAGTDPDGTVVAWRWSSDLDGVLSLEASFSTAALSVGVHQISLDVQDDLGLWSEPDSATLEVRSTTREWILDDGEPGTTPTGYWPASGGTDAYGGGSVYSKQNGSTYRYDFSGLPTGSANVYLWWSTWPSRPTSVPVDIVHASGTSRVLVDQLADGGRWVKIGAWSFSGTARVTITSLGVGSTCADAVKIEAASP